MKPKLSLPQIFAIVLLITLSPVPCALSQVPQGFNYQAVAHSSSGAPIMNTTIQVKMSILSDTLVPVVVWEELHSAVKTNAYGVFSLVIGTGARQSGSALIFSDVDWAKTPLFLKVQVYYQSAWKYMGSAKLWSVPYSMVAANLEGSVGKLEVMGEDETSDEALFEVKRKDGHTMFAVYNHGVRIYMPLDTLSKTRKGGFAIGGFSGTKDDIQDYFVVNPDSIRAYIDTNPGKTRKGGFAVGGFGTVKASGEEYLRVTRDSTRIYLNDTGTKTRKGGFAVGGFGQGKMNIQDFLLVSPDSIRMYIDNEGKTRKGGFAVGSFEQAKGAGLDYFNVATTANDIIDPSQNRVLWYPLKNSFLTGRVLVEKPDSVGENSFATGYESKATGQYSQAMGYQAIARGIYSTSIGYQSVANRDNSFAFGQWAQAKNYESYAFGRGAIAEGYRSFAFGSAGVDSAGMTTGVAYAKGDYSFAIGQGSQALGRGSVALGTADTALYDFSQAFGLFTKSSGHTSTTFGYKTQASNWTSMAIGAGTIAYGPGSFAVGNNSQAGGWAASAFGNHTIATGDLSFSTGNNTKASGSESFSAGNSTQASGPWSASFGVLTVASGGASMAIGDHSVSSGGGSFAGGGGQSSGSVSFAFGSNAKAIGNGSFVLGSESKTTEINSFALGDSAVANSIWAMALGNKTVANGAASIAGGQRSVTYGHHSFAFGYKNVAYGDGSIALNDETKAGADAFATGLRSKANGWCSATFGIGTISNSATSVVIGRYNDTTAMTNLSWYYDSDPAFIVGNGISNTDRKNAFTILQNSMVGINMVNPQQMLDIAGGNGRVESGYNWLTNSDIRFKKNIVTIENPLDKVLAMHGVRFDLINDNSPADAHSKNIGFIAQELEAVVPEVVITGSDGYKSVAYDKLTAVLTEAIKEQQKQIESYKSQVRSLQQEVEQIKALLVMNGTE